MCRYTNSARDNVLEFRSANKKNQCTYCTLRNVTFNAFNPSDITLDYKWVGIYGHYPIIILFFFFFSFNYGNYSFNYGKI